MWRAALAVAVLSEMVVAVPSVQAAPAPARSAIEAVTDPQLLDDIAAATAGRKQAANATVVVEVLTGDVHGVSAGVRNLGGVVTGAVPGHLVQATVPVPAVGQLAGLPGVSGVQSPRRAGYIPQSQPRPEGGTGQIGDEVAITNADEWHDAGITGVGVKVGVIDYFVMSQWNQSELGTKPTLGNEHLFCRDTAPYGLCNGNDINDLNGADHGLAVVEIVKDMAPDADVYIATVGTTADLLAAIDWFASKGVTILTRSLGAAYDGPGNGTGPLAAVVDYAVLKGMTWFNSAGNDAFDAYVRRIVSSTVSAPTFVSGNGQYVDFNAGPAVDTWLRLDAGATGCVLFDGVRWATDWSLPANQRTDYSFEFWEPRSAANEYNDSWNPTSISQVDPIDLFVAQGIQNVYNASQISGAVPLELEDFCVIPANGFAPLYGTGIVFMRMRRHVNTPVGNPDTIEVALADGLTEFGYSNANSSAAKPVVDSRNGGLVAVGAVDSASPGAPPAPNGNNIAYYSSQGPTNDGRVKPDVSAPAGMHSVTFDDTFSGTSAASPVAAGAAALIASAGLATPGAPLAAMVKHFTNDLGSPGPDNAFGFGKILFPAPPTDAPAATPGKYVPLPLPVRALDSRPGSLHVGPANLTGPFTKETIIDFDVLAGPAVPDTGVSAVAINLTSVKPAYTGFLQAYPYLRSTNGLTSTLNISTAGVSRPNFAVVPVGQDGKISVYLEAGGNVIIDVLGYYLDGQVGTATDGRFVSLAEPERWMDTRGQLGAPLPVGFATPRRAAAGETVIAPTLDASLVPDTGVLALVVNVTAANPIGPGFLQAAPTGAVGATHSNVNFVAGTNAANMSIVPLGDGGTISVATSESANIIVDVVGYITDATATADTLGLFVAITPGRAVDTRLPPPARFGAGESRTYTLVGLSAPLPVVPSTASAVSANLTVVKPGSSGFLTVFPNDEPISSNLNFNGGKTTANAAFLALSPTGTVTAKMTAPGDFLIDINGYFLAGLI